MSEADVSQIRDEDVLRRMWQQTEDFGRKKEIRAHMYRLRELRLRTLYEPEPPHGKGPRHHGSSFADQSFASLKSKEVRDAASPPHDYLRQDLKELSNAGWNVESENTTSDEGHTRTRSVHADVEGRYEVEGGQGRFAAADRQREVVSARSDGASSVQRREVAAAAAADEQVIRHTGDGTHYSSHKSSSTSSKIEQVSTKGEVPYVTDDHDARQETRRIDHADEFHSRHTETRQDTSKIDTNVKQSEKILSSSDAEHSLHKQDYCVEGELVSRKVEYPEDNMKLVTETRLLPDGSRVTTTCREYRPPAHAQREDHATRQTRTETKYSTTQKTSDTRESSKVIKESTHNSSRDVKQSRTVDDYEVDTTDFSSKRVEKSDLSNAKHADQISTKNVDYYNAKNTDCSTTRDDSSTVRVDRASRSERRHYDTEQTRRSDATTRDDTQHTKQTRDVKDHTTVQENDIEERVERKTISDQYQTTYQADYQKKVSNDWSPSQQAWASSLRGDTPAAAPLRSSASPDKSRRPASRGASPTKTDRSSPTRSDRYSSHSTITDSTIKYSDTRNSSRSSVSPDKSYRQRPSASPEKTPSFKPSTSPDRRSSRPPSVPRDVMRPSPDRKPGHQRPSEPRATPQRTSSSPDRQAPSWPSTDRSTLPTKSTDTSSLRSSSSPDRKPGYQQPAADRKPSDSPRDTPRSSASPDRKPGYMRPTASSVPRDASPTKPTHGHPTKVSQSPDRKPYEIRSTVSKAQEDHYKFVDEETKSFMRTDSKRSDIYRGTSSSPDRYATPSESPSSRRAPSRDSTDHCRSPSPSLTPTLKGSRSPSPPKGPVTFEDTSIKQTRTEKTDKITSQSNVTSHYDKSKDFKSTSVERHTPASPKKSTPVREPSPSKYGTYDKKRRSEDIEVYSSTTETKSDTLTRRNNTVRKEHSEPITPTKKSPRDSVSPVKSPSKDKYRDTTDFISTERTVEDVNKRKEHPRQLVTPSTSPTRKLKTVEKAPSSGQSSPTSSVSDFTYFSSSQNNTIITTDLDDHFYTETDKSETSSVVTKRPETLDFKRSPTPTKIPCRSPSPDKKSPVKDTMPRKSSLKKKTSTDTMSPSEKPPSTFKVSPSIETADFPEHKVVKKDRPDKPEDKVKPPFERRETYEERCRKILGMMEDEKKTTNKTTTKLFSNEAESNISSPSTSPRRTPTRDSPLSTYTDSVINTKKVSDFIKKETEETVKTSRRDNTSVERKSKTPIREERKSKTPTREPSPTKLKDIIDTTTTVKDDFTIKSEDNSTCNFKTETCESNTFDSKFTRSSPSPSRKAPEAPKDTKGTSEETNKVRSTTKTTDHKSTYTRQAPGTPTSSTPRSVSPTKKPETRKSRTPSPTKRVTKVEETVEFITSEQQKEALDRVERCLRRLSPARDIRSRSSSREKSPGKLTTSLQDLDIVSTIIIEENFSTTDKTLFKEVEDTINEVKEIKPKEIQAPKSVGKPQSRNTSPVKKQIPKTPESPTKPRSMSPRKPISPVERPSSPQIPKVNGTAKPREPISRRPVTVSSPTRTEKPSIPGDCKKSGIPKQNSFTSKTTTKSTVTNKTQSNVTKSAPKSPESPETKREIPKGNKENVSPKKEDTRFTRTPSDNTIKTKKPSPQRTKSKPEIQVTDFSSKYKQNVQNRTQKTTKESNSFASKPKSATALNTQGDEHDVIVNDVEHAKSSRESSPDRICPTPVQEDLGTPRYPDEVSEPDDEFRRRTHHTIHEAESLVDDIVEISEEEELFTKKVDKITQSDECLLSVNDKVSKFTSKIENVTKPKESSTSFKDTERRVHSDFGENLKSDECLLSVSQKVSKFATSRANTRSPSRNIVDEYDNQTTYTDDYSKRSVNDKAHFFVETADNVTVPKMKPAPKVERPDLTDVDDALRTDDCLLSVSDKVNKFVKTAEQFLSESTEIEDKEKRIREQHEKIMKVVQNMDFSDEEIEKKPIEKPEKIREPGEEIGSFAKKTTSSQAKTKDYASPNLKPTERPPVVKITTLRSSEAVKKAKAMFENIATTQKTTESTTKATKLTDIGVIKKSPKTDSTTVLHPSLENVLDTDDDSEVDSPLVNGKDRRTDVAPSPARPAPHSPDATRTKSPATQHTDGHKHTPDTARNKSPMRTSTDTTHILPKHPVGSQPDSAKLKEAPEKPGYLKATTTSQLKEETRVEDLELPSTRRGSGKFGVELRRTSADRGPPGADRSPASSERRRSSDHHQPCIEDVFDLPLLEQMLEKVVGYEQRRRIRAQIRVARRQQGAEPGLDTSIRGARVTAAPRHASPDRKPQRGLSPDRAQHKEQARSLLNGFKEPARREPPSDKRQRTSSPEKKAVSKTRSPARHPSPEKKTRTTSPSKVASPRPKTNRFNEYASAYMKKVGLNETDKKAAETKTTKTELLDTEKAQFVASESKIETQKSETKKESSTISKSYTSRTSSKDLIQTVQVNGKSSPSPERAAPASPAGRAPRRRTPEPASPAGRPADRSSRRTPEQPPGPASPTDRVYRRSPSPDFKRRHDAKPKETIIKTVVEDKKADEKPSWMTNRKLKKASAESRTFSSKKVEEKKARGGSPARAGQPLDLITSSYGIGPLGDDGRPLFGIKALRNGASNYQVRGTVVRSEYHSRNGGAPAGSVSVTAYCSDPAPLERLLASQGERPSRLHGLAAITTTRKFGGTTGTSIREAHSKEERAAIEQFTHHDRKVAEDAARYDTTTYAEDRREDARRVAADARVEELAAASTEKKGDNKRVKEERSSQEKEERYSKKVKEEEKSKMERREDRKTVRQSSVKSLTEKFIKNASDSTRSERAAYPRAAYPRAGLILRSSTLQDSVTSDPEVTRTGSSNSLASSDGDTGVLPHRTHGDTAATSHRAQDAGTTTSRTTHVTVHTQGNQRTSSQRSAAGRSFLDSSAKVSSQRSAAGRSFLDSSAKVSGVQDILSRMRDADIVIEPGDSASDAEARALLNKFLGASVLMGGMQGYMQGAAINQEPHSAPPASEPAPRPAPPRAPRDLDVDQCWDERLLRQLLEECTDYDQRRRLRARVRSLMAEQEEEEEVTTVTSSVRRDSAEKSVSSSTTTTKSSKVIESMTRPAPKPVSPFAKFRQLEKQNSTSNPNSPATPQSPGSQPYFRFTDAALQSSAATIKERLLQWCRDKTRDYENVKLENFSTSWADGLAFCALVHHFLPDAFDYSQLTPDKRRHNFTLAFKIADEKAGIYPLLDVDDMVAMRRPDWKCVFTYVQAIHRRFKDQH